MLPEKGSNVRNRPVANTPVRIETSLRRDPTPCLGAVTLSPAISGALVLNEAVAPCKVENNALTR